MKKLHELLHKLPIEGDVGIEIECEGAGFTEVFSQYWKSEDDGSLRGRYPGSRIEYVLGAPIKVNKVREALEELKCATIKAIPNFSYRTSVHVHVNVLELTEDQLLSFMYTYLLLEEPLMNYCGNTRKCNRFCLRLQDADASLEYLMPIFKEGVDRIVVLDQEQVRYAAMNLAAIKKYGSVEFRGMRGTMDVDVLDVWAHALISVRNFACNFTSVLQVHDCYVKKGPEEFFKFVLGDLATHFQYKGLVQDIQRSYSLSIDLPNVFNKRGKKEEKPKEKVVKPKLGEWIPPEQRVIGVDFGMADVIRQDIVFAMNGAAQQAPVPKPKPRVRVIPGVGDFAEFDDIIEREEQ